MNYTDKTILVVGGGVSGLAACHYLLKQGSHVILSDNKSKELLLQKPEISALVKKGVQLLPQNEIPEKISWELVVVSPGVPLHIPLLNISREAGVAIIGEIELAYAAAKAPFIGITGTNGKTTTTALTAHILQNCGVDILLGGNIGTPLVDSVEDFKGDYIVAELSSFQLESCITFKPKVAAYLNLTPDHLDRHYDMENYGTAKERIFANQDENDFAVLNWDDPLVRSVEKNISAKILWFSLHCAPENGIYFEEGILRYIVDGAEVFSFDSTQIFIKGRHNVQNAMAAFLATAALKLDPAKIAEAIISFKGVAHRLEYVVEKDGILYVNDSKGTNPASTFQAINAYERPMILLLGGRNKGSDFSELMQLVKAKVKLAIIFGEATAELKAAADTVGYKSYLIANDFDHAVALAKDKAQSGDVVILSPACASWDSFNCFEERGERFKELVK